MLKHRYAREKLRDAVHSLVGDGAIAERLGYALRELALLKPEDFPEELRDRFVNLKADLMQRLDGGKYAPVRIVTRAPKSGTMAEEVFALFLAVGAGD